MSEEKNNVIINFNGREYTEDDLNEEQVGLAVKLNTAGKQLLRLQEAADTYAMINEYKNILIEAFHKTLPVEEEEVIEEE
jgi:hypothetical protein|tara:strand:- start:1278 stop:1517 length:240 start_codon:yes stop_codon:yes gene_type:complete